MTASTPKFGAVPTSMITGDPFYMQVVPCPETWKSRRVFSAPFQVETLRRMIHASDEKRFAAASPPTNLAGGRVINFRRPRKIGESEEVKRITASDLAKLNPMLQCGYDQERIQFEKKDERVFEATVEKGEEIAEADKRF